MSVLRSEHPNPQCHSVSTFHPKGETQAVLSAPAPWGWKHEEIAGCVPGTQLSLMTKYPLFLLSQRHQIQPLSFRAEKEAITEKN